MARAFAASVRRVASPFIFLLTVLPLQAQGAIVYDNTTTTNGSFTGLGDFWRGDEITLAGPERVVTEFLFGYTAIGTGSPI